jgi:hypothetical protein
LDYAPLNSPQFNGNPRGPTPSLSDNDTSLATTEFVKGQGYITSSALSSYLTTADASTIYTPLAGASSLGQFNWDFPMDSNYVRVERSGITLGGSSSIYILGTGFIDFPDTSRQTVAYPGPSGFLLKADNLSGLASTSTARTNLGLGTMATATASDYSTTTVANGLYYPLSSNPAGYLTSAPVTSVAGRTGAVTLAVADVSGAAPIASPTFTGTPAAPTATAGTSTTQLATTAFVTTADNLKANLASPTFTGVPAAPTATAGTNTTQIATTAFVTAAVPAFATNAEALLQSSATTAISPANAPFVMSNGMTQRLDFIKSTSISGNGAVTTGFDGFREMYTNSTGAVGRASWNAGAIGVLSFIHSLGSEAVVNFSKKIWVSGRFVANLSATYVGDANGFVSISLGGYTANTTGSMTVRGFGLRKTGGAASVVQLVVHNGSSESTVNTSKTCGTMEVVDFMLYSNGAGTVQLYLNGTLAATSSSGPTGNSGNFQGVYREQAEQTASATVRHLLHCYGGQVISER